MARALLLSSARPIHIPGTAPRATHRSRWSRILERKPRRRWCLPRPVKREERLPNGHRIGASLGPSLFHPLFLRLFTVTLLAFIDTERSSVSLISSQPFWRACLPPLHTHPTLKRVYCSPVAGAKEPAGQGKQSSSDDLVAPAPRHNHTRSALARLSQLAGRLTDSCCGVPIQRKVGGDSEDE